MESERKADECVYVPLKLLLGFVAYKERQIPSLENKASLTWTFSKW